MRYVLLLALIGCGGPEFTTFEPDTEADAGTVGPFADGSVPLYDLPGREAGAPRDAAGAVDAPTLEASATVEASMQDSAPVCAAHSVNFAGTCFDGLSSSATVAVWVVNPPPTTGCGGSAGSGTPPPCMCAYTCACLAAHSTEIAACDGNGGWGSCSESNGYPIVVCAN
jgi:hypothetical protein